jgi:hypothetical protein
MPDAPELPKDQGYQVQTAFDTNRNLPLVVGRTKISGTVVAKELSDDYQYLHVFYALCVSDANFTATVESVTIAGQSDEDSEPVWENGSMTTGTRFTNGKLSIYISNGTGFGYDPTNAGCTIYDPLTMRFEGMVAVYARYKYDREVYRGEPALEFIVNGVDSNPAAALELYLKDSRYGAGIPVSNINESSFDAAIYLCDENVDTEDKYLLSNDFVTRSRYTYNGILDTGKELSENMQDLITVMDGNLVVSEGKYTLLLNAKGDAVLDFNQENVIGKIEENTNSSEQRYNTAEIKFTDKELDYKTNSAIYVDEDAKNNRDNGIELKKTVTVNGVVHFDEAMDFAEKLVKKSNYNRQVKLTSAWENDVEVGEIVSVTYEQFGYTGKEYRVAEKDISISGTIDYVLNEHEDNVYDIENGNENPSQGVLTYPNPFAKPPAVTNVSLAEVSQSKFNVSFDEINSSVVDTYELSMVRNSDLVTYKFYSNQSPIFGEISEAGTYTYSIVAINDLQIRGTATTGQSYVAGGFEQEWDNVIGANKPQDNATKNEAKGEWSSQTSYETGDFVNYNSSSYVAIGASTNSTPSSNPSDWTLLAAGGENGVRGTAALFARTEKEHILSSNDVALLWNSVAPVGYDGEIEGDNIAITSDHAVSGGTKIYAYKDVGGTLTWVEETDFYINGNAVIDGTLSAEKITTGTITGEKINTSTEIIIGKLDGLSDYIHLDGQDGSLKTYKYIAGGMRLQKQLTRSERGVANSGDTVTLSGYWSEQPDVQVSINTLTSYLPQYSEQSQTWACRADNIRETSTGVWAFDAKVDLSLGDASGESGLSIDSSETSSNTYTSSVFTTPQNTLSVNPTVRLKSVRGTGTSPNYYLRQVRWRVGYATTAGGVYTWSTYQTKGIGQTLNSVTDSREVALPSSGVWYIKIEFIAEDAGGTWTSGSVEYDYSQATKTNSSTVTDALYTEGSKSLDLTLPSYSPPSGWSVYEVDYSVQYSYYVQGCDGGTGIVTGMSLYVSKYDGSGCSSFGDSSLNNWTTKTDSDGSYNVNKLRGVLRVDERFTSSSGTAKLGIRNGSANIKIRKPKVNSTTPVNQFEATSYSYQLSSALILASGTLSWIAVGK